MAASLSRVLSSLLYEVDSTDPATYAGVVGLIGIAGLMGVWRPLRQALRVDPRRALTAAGIGASARASKGAVARHDDALWEDRRVGRGKPGGWKEQLVAGASHGRSSGGAAGEEGFVHPRPGPVRLRVADPARSAAFYRDVLGLEPRVPSDRWTPLAAPEGGPVLVELAKASTDDRPGPGAPGLFHMAFRVPDRPALARAVERLRQKGASFHGFSDHLVSEAAYLADPEGNGIEIYRDRPREEWPVEEGHVRMDTSPLDVEGLLAGSEASRGRSIGSPRADGGALPPATIMGHVHLRVSELSRAEAFLTGAVGLAVTVRDYEGALFFAYGGYHHHVGVNVWGRRVGGGDSTVTPGAPGLESWSLVFADPDGVRTVAEAARKRGFAVAESDDGVALTDADGLVAQLRVGG